MTDLARKTHRPLTTAAVLCGTFVSAIEMTIVGTAMPRIVGALGGSDRFAWVISIYLLTSTVSAPLSGKLADLFGRKPVYQIGMALFLLGSALSGAAPTMDTLIVARAIQGVGGGALGTVSLTITGDLFTPVERGRIQGLFSGVWGLAGALGPLVGGMIVDHIGWRWIFYLNLPFGAAAMALLAVSLHERVERKPASLDVLGALVLTAAIVALQLAGGGEGQGAHASERAWIAAVAAVALLAAFVAIERRAQAPIVPLGLLRNRLVATALSASLLAGAVMFGVLNFIPLYVQGVLGASAQAAGAVVTPSIVAWPLASIGAGLLIARIDTRVLVRIGMSLIAVGALLPALVHADSVHARAVFVAAGLCFGTGMGASSTPLLIALQSAVGWEMRGVVTAGFSFCRTMGGTLGVVLAGAIQSARLAARGVRPETVDAMLRPGASIGAQSARESLAFAVHGAFVAVAVVGAAAWLAGLAFPRTRMKLTEPVVVAHEG